MLPAATDPTGYIPGAFAVLIGAYAQYRFTGRWDLTALYGGLAGIGLVFCLWFVATLTWSPYVLLREENERAQHQNAELSAENSVLILQLEERKLADKNAEFARHIPNFKGVIGPCGAYKNPAVSSTFGWLEIVLANHGTESSIDNTTWKIEIVIAGKRISVKPQETEVFVPREARGPGTLISLRTTFYIFRTCAFPIPRGAQPKGFAGFTISDYSPQELLAKGVKWVVSGKDHLGNTFTFEREFGNEAKSFSYSDFEVVCAPKGDYFGSIG